MRWFEQPEVLSYIIESYAGVDGRKRQFIWEDKDGNTVIGNSRAFTDHCRDRFNLDISDKSWSGLHEAMRALGEVASAYTPRAAVRGGRFKNQEPESHIIKRPTTATVRSKS